MSLLPVMIAVSLFSAASSYKTGQAARRRAKTNARLERLRNVEEQKRFKRADAQKQGLARARAAASGAGGESQSLYLNALSKIGSGQLDWLKKTGRLNVKSIEQEGDVAWAQAMQGVVSSLGKAATAGYGMANPDSVWTKNTVTTW